MSPNADDCKARDAPKVSIPLEGKVLLGDEAKGGSLGEERNDADARRAKRGNRPENRVDTGLRAFGWGRSALPS